MKRVEDYRCKHPSFVVKLSPSQAQFKCQVNIPLAFVRKYLKNDLGEFKLRNVTGMTWLVRCCASGDSHVNLKCNGWRCFALDNELREGDICVFELIKGAKKTFRVGVLPAARENPKKATRKSKLEVD